MDSDWLWDFVLLAVGFILGLAVCDLAPFPVP
jgi:hypothetical protein